MDKEAELLKIQIYADYIHTRTNVFLPIIFGILITGLFFGVTLLYEHLISLESDVIILAVIFVVCVLGVNYFIKDYEKEVKQIFSKINALVEKNELPNLKI